MLISIYLDARDTMYPCDGRKVFGNQIIEFPPYSTLYGYCFDSTSIHIGTDEFNMDEWEYFCIPMKEDRDIEFSGNAFIVCRYGFNGQRVIGRVERKGRLTYIDGCSDSLLVYPPRFGDPSLNSLHFPSRVQQTYHRHPSVRLGCVIQGNGIAKWGNYKTESILLEGDCFMLYEQELHRFETTEHPMTVIAFHPDGDWGPTDHNHTMLNRTYVTK